MAWRRPIPRCRSTALAAGLTLSAGAAAQAHINPPLALLGEREALAIALPGATEFARVRLELSAGQKRALRTQWSWAADEQLLQGHVGRGPRGAAGVVVLVSEITIHGSVRVAVGVGPDGRVTGAALVEVSQEVFPWVRPLLERGVLRSYVGLGAGDEFLLPDDASEGGNQRMRRFFAKIVVSMVRAAVALHEVGALPATR
jgi:hypothetical protein